MRSTGTGERDRSAWGKFDNSRKNGNLDMGTKTCSEGLPPCTRCNGQEIWRRGENSAGNKQYFCKSCEKTFVPEPYLKDDVRIIAERMLYADIPVPTIVEVLQGFVSRSWLYTRKRDLNG